MNAPLRPPLYVDTVRASLNAPWTSIELVETTESTNSDLVGAANGAVLVADYQSAGRGRLDRTWASPARAGLLFSVLLRPDVPSARWGWLPLLTGVALCEAIGSVAGFDVALKWPNDVLTASGSKLAGVLAQVADGAVVIGVGLNVSTTRDELPVETATSLALEFAHTLARDELLAAILAALGSRYLIWAAAGGDAEACGLADDYRALCNTVGHDVMVSTHGAPLQGTVVGIDSDGQLRLRLADTEVERAVAAGDIVHLRPAGPQLG